MRVTAAQRPLHYSDFHGEMQATDASGLPVSMIVPDAPQALRPVDPQAKASASQAAQDPKDLDVLIDASPDVLGAPGCTIL